MSGYHDLPGSHDVKPCSGCGYPIDACECESLFGDDPYAPHPIEDDEGDDKNNEVDR